MNASVDRPLVAEAGEAATVAKPAGVALESLDYAETFLLAALDAALAAAESLGLGAVYIGALRNDPAAVARLLDLPPRAAAVSGLVVGHPDPSGATAIKPHLPRRAESGPARLEPCRRQGRAFDLPQSPAREVFPRRARVTPGRIQTETAGRARASGNHHRHGACDQGRNRADSVRRRLGPAARITVPSTARGSAARRNPRRRRSWAAASGRADSTASTRSAAASSRAGSTPIARCAGIPPR